MKKIVLILAALALAGTLSAAAPTERIFVSTDRSAYLAGDAVWCSLTCLDENGLFSNASAVSYVELVSEEGTACTAKIGLLEGRGAGSFRIPVTTPTGTYRILAYTAVNAAENGTPWLAGSRLVTVFNTTSRARVAGNVVIGSGNAPLAQEEHPAAEGLLELSARVRLPKGQSAVLSLHNGGAAASVSLSIYHADDLPEGARENTPAGFLKALPASVSPVRAFTVENDGEIISARIRGAVLKADDLTLATLSAAGSPTDLYIGRTEGDDRLRFYTSNIYGNREIVCEVAQLDRQEGYIDFESPFLFPETGPLPKLMLDPALRPDLNARKASLRAEKTRRIDTLITFMTHREDLLLASIPSRRYHLDDYTRFHSVKEILVEITPELHLRMDHGEPSLQLTYSDALERRSDRTDNIAVMMDGVLLSDLNLLLNFLRPAARVRADAAARNRELHHQEELRHRPPLPGQRAGGGFPGRRLPGRLQRRRSGRGGTGPAPAPVLAPDPEPGGRFRLPPGIQYAGLRRPFQGRRRRLHGRREAGLSRILLRGGIDFSTSLKMTMKSGGP